MAGHRNGRRAARDAGRNVVPGDEPSRSTGPIHRDGDAPARSPVTGRPTSARVRKADRKRKGGAPEGGTPKGQRS